MQKNAAKGSSQLNGDLVIILSEWTCMSLFKTRQLLQMSECYPESLQTMAPPLSCDRCRTKRVISSRIGQHWHCRQDWLSRSVAKHQSGRMKPQSNHRQTGWLRFNQLMSLQWATLSQRKIMGKSRRNQTLCPYSCRSLVSARRRNTRRYKVDRRATSRLW